jgi:hypothetical protein
MKKIFSKKFALGILLTALILTVATYSIFQLPSFGGSFTGERKERMQSSPQFISGRFENTQSQIDACCC